jgi:hypothetical protein
LAASASLIIVRFLERYSGVEKPTTSGVSCQVFLTANVTNIYRYSVLPT